MEKENEPKTDIAMLLDDVLLEIFGFLRGSKDSTKSDLINATLVCKQWNRLITESPRLINKLKLEVKLRDLLDDETIMNREFKLARPYQHVTLGPRVFFVSGQQKRKKVKEIFQQTLSLDSLTTLNIVDVKITPKLIEALSKIESLRVLVVDRCSHKYDDSRFTENEVSRFNFDKLRQLQFIKCDSFELNQYIDCFKCKELDSYAIESLSSFGIAPVRVQGQELYFYLNTGFVVQSLNELDRCDKIVLDTKKWNFNGRLSPLSPKFTWNKLKLKYRQAVFGHRNAVSFIEALCKASKSNAESEIELENIEDGHENLWTAILNNCKALTLSNSTIPFVLAPMRLLPELKQLKIDRKTFDHANFVRLAKKLTGVTHLHFHEIEDLEQNFKLSSETALQLQSFFDQIVELTLPKEYMRIKETEDNDDVNDLVPLLEIEFMNLKTLTLIENIHSKSLAKDCDVQLSNFCTRNQSLSHLNVEAIGWQDTEESLDDLQLIWYEKLHGNSAVQSCNILVDKYVDSLLAWTNWREAEVDEVQLFGRLLTEDENRFFI